MTPTHFECVRRYHAPACLAVILVGRPSLRYMLSCTNRTKHSGIISVPSRNRSPDQSIRRARPARRCDRFSFEGSRLVVVCTEMLCQVFESLLLFHLRSRRKHANDRNYKEGSLSNRRYRNDSASKEETICEQASHIDTYIHFNISQNLEAFRRVCGTRRR